MDVAYICSSLYYYLKVQFYDQQLANALIETSECTMIQDYANCYTCILFCITIPSPAVMSILIVL